MLLRDIRAIFSKLEVCNAVADLLITNLREVEEGPWATIRAGAPLNPRGLAQQLRKYGIEPKPQRDGDRVFRGYSRAQFEDAWSRYLPALGPAAMETVTSVTSTTSERCSGCGTVLEHADSRAKGLCAECRLIPPIEGNSA